MSLEFGKYFGNSTAGGGFPNSPGFIPVRVVEVNITPDDNETSLFKVQENYWGVGSIRFESLNEAQNLRGDLRNNIALPLNINIRTLPLVNEIVFIILGPSKENMVSGDPTAQTYYYTNSLPTWNNTNANVFPSQLGEGDTSTDTNTIQAIEAGIPNNPDNPKSGPTTGKVYEETSDIKNLYPQEGDVMVEGRFGNSIRFTSTNRQSEDFKDIQSPWSREGNNGSPLTIIRNGQQSTSGFDQFLPLYEDIDRDDSSIYMTTTQNIGITLASTNLNSFGIDITPQVKTSARIQRTPKGESGKSNNDSDNINITFDSVNVEPKGASNSVSPNDLDELSNLSSNPTEFERDEIELTRSEEIEQQQRDRGGERDI